MIPTQAQYDAAVKDTESTLRRCGFVPFAAVSKRPPDLDPGSARAWDCTRTHSGYPLWYGANAAFHELTKTTAVGQRKRNDQAVGRLYNVIRGGHWLPLNSSPVVFTWPHPDAAGDGNTRLHAFKNSGHGGLITVMAGADPDWLLAQLDKNPDTVPQALGRLATDNPAFVKAVPSLTARNSITAVVRVHFSVLSPRSGSRIRELPKSVYARKILDNLHWLDANVSPFPVKTVYAAPAARYAFCRAYDDPAYTPAEVTAAATAFAKESCPQSVIATMFGAFKKATETWRGGATGNNLKDEDAVMLFVQTARYLDAMRRKQYQFTSAWPAVPCTEADVKAALALTAPANWAVMQP